jgi:hypothetical protein
MKGKWKPFKLQSFNLPKPFDSSAEFGTEEPPSSCSVIPLDFLYLIFDRVAAGVIKEADDIATITDILKSSRAEKIIKAIR